MGTVLVRLFGVVIGFAGVWACAQAIRAQAVARTWPIATAHVTHRGVARARAANLGAPAFQFTPDVRCRYTVAGTVYEGGTWYPPAVLRPPRGSMAWATRMAASVPDVTPVRYDPVHPRSPACIWCPAGSSWRPPSPRARSSASRSLPDAPDLYGTTIRKA